MGSGDGGYLSGVKVAEEVHVAELTQLEDALGEVLGLARAARQLTLTVERGVGNDDVALALRAIRDEATETARRCDAIVGRRDGRKTAIRARARTTSKEAREMLASYLDTADGPLRAVEFLGMAEAGELSHLEVLGGLALTAGDDEIVGLVDWALPIQRRHVTDVRDAGIVLAAQVEPAGDRPASVRPVGPRAPGVRRAGAAAARRPLRRSGCRAG